MNGIYAKMGDNDFFVIRAEFMAHIENPVVKCLRDIEFCQIWVRIPVQPLIPI